MELEAFESVIKTFSSFVPVLARHYFGSFPGGVHVIPTGKRMLVGVLKIQVFGFFTILVSWISAVC